MSNVMKIEEKLIESLRSRKDKENFGVGIENVVGVNVIVTYLTDPQEFFDCGVLIKPINDSINEQYSVEKDILIQIINHINGDKEQLVKLSMCFYTPFKNREELIKSGYGFILRTNSKYYFLPSERDNFEDEIVNSLNICNYLI